MPKEIRIPHSEIGDSQTITDVNIRKFKEEGLDIHHNEVSRLEDDFSRGERILTIENPKYFLPSELYRQNYDLIDWSK